VLAATDLILSRAGSNAIFEFLSLQKPNLLVPLSKAASRGDQILNAEAFAAKGYSRVLAEDKLNDGSLLRELEALRAESGMYVKAMGSSPFRDGAEKVMEQIRSFIASQNSHN
jgi:UDP-N-acetylglucosamine--N-acetylmuramyl-(pentapeptide) pyrophosphoryl-undecaprenol N-acetylglucosamine transferase